MQTKYQIHAASDGLPLALMDVETGVRVATFNQQLATRAEHAALIVQAVNERCALLERVGRLEGALRQFAAQKLLTEMSAEDYEMGDIDFAYDKFIEESRALLAPPPARPVTQPDKKD